MLVCAGSSNLPLATTLAQKLHAKLVERELSIFPNGEKRVFLRGDVKGKDVLVVQSLAVPVDENLVEFALLVDAVHRAGAKRIFGLIPWLGYSLQNHVFRVGESLAAGVVANFISTLPLVKLFLVDVHDEEVTGLFSVHAQNISVLSIFAEHVVVEKNTVVVAPDAGSRKRSKAFASLLHLPVVEMSKSRNRETGEVTLQVDKKLVTGKRCIVVDDVINTGRTLIHVAQLLKKSGASHVQAITTHILHTDKNVQAIKESGIDAVLVSDTVHNDAFAKLKKVTLVSAASLLAENILKQV